MRKGKLSPVLLAGVLLAVIAAPAPVLGAWSNDPAVNTAAAMTGAADTTPVIIGDGSGGAIIAWMGAQINAQKIDAKGNVKWGANGVIVSAGGSSQYYPQLVSDGSGGAIITWQDQSTGDIHIYAQRIDANGNAMWTPHGVPISTAANKQQNPQLVSDGSGGAIIAWQDSRNGVPDLNYDIYVQRVDANGNVQWRADGIPICTEGHHQQNPQLVSDGNGGAIITWQDARVFWAIYAQRIDQGGNALWAANGVAVSTSDNPYKLYPQIISDDGGGAIITWQDNRSSGSGDDIYAQRINSGGNALWTENGVAVSTAPNVQWNPQLVSDGSGGAIISWWDARSGANYHIYAQRVDANGAGQWAPDGALICNENNIDMNYYAPQLTGDGSHGAIITWAHGPNPGSYDIYAQRIGADGAGQWAANGVAVSTAANHQQHPKLISLGSGGAIITWQDVRSGGWDIYAQKLLADGSLPEPTPASIVDFDGDGKTDLAIYREAWGAWYLQPSGGGDVIGLGWGGGPSDIPVPGDYDGDGKTDVAIYRFENGAWWIIPSSTGIPYGVGHGGGATDIPVPGDYDGDGKTDIAIYRMAWGAWYIVPSGGGSTIAMGWGGGLTDIPVPGDYDGDGKTDMAIYRAENGAWWIIPSSTGIPYGIGHGGGASDIPVPGDYDGDGKTDLAIYRKAWGAWYVVPSGGGSTIVADWGGGLLDIPVPGDYDGDGKIDVAIYRIDNGAWWIIPSSTGTPYGVGFGGGATDIPVIVNPALRG